MRGTRRTLLPVILLLCIAGLWISNGLLALHDGVPPASSAAGRLIAHLCTAANDGLSGCEMSARSAWSEIHFSIPGHPADVPVAFLAIGYFIALGTWYAFVGEALPAWRPLRWLPVAVAVAGIYASLFFVSLMVMGRAPWCGGCITVHAINLLLVISIALSRSMSGEPGNIETVVGNRQCVAVIAFAVLLIGVLYTSRDRRLRLQDRIAELAPDERMIDSVQNNPKLLIDAYLAQPKQSVVIRPDETSTTAKHELVLFLDYQCPACLITERIVRDEISAHFAGSLNVVLHHYPLCRACNAKIPRTIHPEACEAAYAAEAARSLGGRAAFERMSDLLFADQANLDSDINRELATQAGVDPDQFMKLLHDPAVEKRVAEDVAQAHALGVNSTPSIFLDGRQVPQICLVPAFWKAVADSPASP